MWHEQRKEEKRIKGLMVDRQRRAERRRDYYEKIKTDPNQFLQVHGRPLKIHLDPSMALAADSPANMMPWNGDRSILIDRFDVRANLDYIPEYKPVKEHENLDYKEAKEYRLTNYERYRILVQNEFLGIQEEKFLKMIDLEEKYGGTTYQNQKAKEEKKKSVNKAAIGFLYADTAAAQDPESEPEQPPSDSDTESEPDFDLNVDVMSLGTEEQDQLNSLGLTFELGKRDFVKMLAKDVEEAEELRMQREKEAEKSTLSGKKSRRERKMLKEKRLEGRTISPPSFAAKEARSAKSRSRSYSRSDSESDHDEDEAEEKVEFITSFGGGDSDPESKNGITFRKVKTKAYKDPIGPTLPSSTRSRRDHKDRRSRRRSRSRSIRKARSGSRRDRSRHRDRHRRKRSRRRSRSRSRSRSGSKSSSRSSLTRKESRRKHGARNGDEAEEESPPLADDTPKKDRAASAAEEHMPKYNPASNHHPSMLAYPPPPKPEYMTHLDIVERPPPLAPPILSPNFVPPLPKVPHPEDVSKTKEKGDSSDSSEAEEDHSASGYRSKYRNKRASSEEEGGERPSLYQASMSSFFSGVSENIKDLVHPQPVEPPPVKRYYGRRKDGDSDSELSADSDQESKKKISHKIIQRVEKKSKQTSAPKEDTLALREKIRKKMQQQIKRTYKEDKKAELERLKKLEEEQFFREEELREISEKRRAKERERRMLERSPSRSQPKETEDVRSTSGNRKRSRSRDRQRSKDGKERRPREKSKSRERPRSRSRRRRSRSRQEPKLVDY